MDDWELLNAYRTDRSEAAFAQLVRRHAGFVYATCRRRLRNDAHLAEDVTQSVFLVLARRPPAPKPGAALAGWLYQTAVYTCGNAMRSKLSRDRLEHAFAQDLASRSNSVPELNAETESFLEQSLAELSAKERDALLLRYYQEMEVQDVARALGISSNSATKRLTRAVARLRKLMLARGMHVPSAAVGAFLAEASRSPAPPELMFSLASVSWAHAATGAFPATIERLASEVIHMLRVAQLKFTVTVLAIVIVVIGGSAATIAMVQARVHASASRPAEPPATRPASRPVGAPGAGRALVLQQQAWESFQRREFDKARDLFQQSVDLDATLVNSWNGLAWSRMSLGDTDSAVTAFEQGLRLDANDLSALSGLGALRFMQGRLGQAEQMLLRAADVSPDAAFALGRLYAIQSRWDEAGRWLRHAAENPHGAEYPLMAELQKAVRDKRLPERLRGMIAPPMPTPAAKELLGAAMLLQRGESGAAREALDRAMELAPNDPEVLSQVGRFHLNSGDAELAMQFFQQALAVEPDNAAAMHGAAMCVTRRGDAGETIAAWRNVLKRYPQSTEAATRLAAALLDAQRFDEALPMCEKLAKEMPENEGVQALLARARERGGR